MLKFDADDWPVAYRGARSASSPRGGPLRELCRFACTVRQLVRVPRQELAEGQSAEQVSSRELATVVLLKTWRPSTAVREVLGIEVVGVVIPGQAGAADGDGPPHKCALLQLGSAVSRLPRGLVLVGGRRAGANSGGHRGVGPRVTVFPCGRSDAVLPCTRGIERGVMNGEA